MSLSRRSFLKLAAAVAGSAALAACKPVYALLGEKPLSGSLDALPQADFQVLNRLTFGATPEVRRRFAHLGLHAWLEEQLRPEALEDTALHLRLRNLTTLGMSAGRLRDVSDQLLDGIDRQRVPAELRQATLLRQVYSRAQLYERVVEFWSDHFNITTEKGDCFYLKTVDDREVVRAHALGRFRDLLWASAHSPAMLVYLDNQANRKGAPNENYAREIMELHTLGVHGGYTQRDVMELARCLTGWTVKEHFWPGTFTFDAGMHDFGPKTVLGVAIAPRGQAETEQVLEILAAHPSTARHLAFKLARRFIADSPPAALVERVAQTFLQAEGDMRTVLRVLLTNGLAHMQPKYRRPVDFVCAALRLLEAETSGGQPVQQVLQRMGQPYFGWPTPDGYPDESARWQGNLMPRWQFAFALARNQLDGVSVDLPALMARAGASTLPEAVDQCCMRLLGAPLPAGQRDALLKIASADGAEEDEVLAVIVGGILASPAFQWR
ncbi:MAG: DUF1800 domain-containing protein [Anaerolineae bacterium]|nr:MAG: DUF1800 domain-containing protein [Anaerolineae bacterium]